MSRLNKNLATIVLVAGAAGLFAGCGDDDDSTAGAANTAENTVDHTAHTPATTAAAPTTTADETPDTTPATTPDTTAAAPATVAPTTVDDGGDTPQGDLGAFCTAYTEISMLMSMGPDPAAIAANAEIVKASAPAEITAEANVMTDAVGAVLASNGEDFSAMETPEFAAAQGTVDPFVFANCEFDTKVEAVGVDFAFNGLPETIEGGRVALLFTNEGAEAHEIVIMRRNDGVTESFEDLLGLPEEEAMGKVTPVGGAFAATTGATGLLIGDFAPGDYIALCFVPVGTTMHDGEFTEGTGAPHFTHGMQQEFTVTG